MICDCEDTATVHDLKREKCAVLNRITIPNARANNKASSLINVSSSCLLPPHNFRNFNSHTRAQVCAEIFEGRVILWVAFSLDRYIKTTKSQLKIRSTDNISTAVGVQARHRPNRIGLRTVLFYLLRDKSVNTVLKFRALDRLLDT